MPGKRCKDKYVYLPQEIRDFIYDNYSGNGPKKMTGIIAEVFGFHVRYEVIRAFYKNHRIVSGESKRYQTGFVPWNKGLAGYSPPGSEKTRFKPGHLPKQTLPVGTERISKDGYVEVKVAMPNRWLGKHRVIWEQYYGKIPAGHVVIFKDQNIRNLDPDNLLCISRQQLAVLNHQLKLGQYSEVNETKIILGEMILMTKQRRCEQ